MPLGGGGSVLMNDDRHKALAILGRLQVHSFRAVWITLAVFCFAALVAVLPGYEGMSSAGRATLFILLCGAGLWMTEAIPAFAVAILIMAMEIAILGRPGGVFATGKDDWIQFVRPWASPVIWLFFGGFVLAEAAGKTQLDRWFSRHVLRFFGDRPAGLLLGVMSVTFCFSMFVSNTATTAMMLTVIGPMLAQLPSGDPFRKALLLSVPFAANIGGMGTVIGSPPNAIAAGALRESHPIDFLEWMSLGLPPAIVLFFIVWGFLVFRYRPGCDRLKTTEMEMDEARSQGSPLWERLVVMGTFLVTVVAWLAEPLHQIPTPVISFFPITVFAVFQILGAQEIRRLPWDVLLLLTGGLSLGVAVAETGLATWLGSRLSSGEGAAWGLVLALAYLCSAFSNFMSNTAAANILIPLGLALGVGMEVAFVVPIALAASAAMCLPVSTPPNAIAYSQGNLASRDFLTGGVLVGIISPALGMIWCWWMIR